MTTYKPGYGPGGPRTPCFMASARPRGMRVEPEGKIAFTAVPDLLEAEWADRLSAGAYALNVSAWVESHRSYTDGVLSERSAERLPYYRPARVRELVEAKVWERIDGGYFLVGWSTRNTPYEELIGRASRGGQKGGHVRAQTGQRGPDGRYLPRNSDTGRSQLDHKSNTTSRAPALESALDSRPISRTKSASGQHNSNTTSRAPKEKEKPKASPLSAGAFAGALGGAPLQHSADASGRRVEEAEPRPPVVCWTCGEEIAAGQKAWWLADVKASGHAAGECGPSRTAEYRAWEASRAEANAAPDDDLPW